MIAGEEEVDIAELDVITIVALVLSSTLLGKKRVRPVRQHISILTGQHYYNETKQNLWSYPAHGEVRNRDGARRFTQKRRCANQ
jgi:hypothetical protein